MASTQTDQASVRVEITVQAPIERSFSVFTERVDAWWPRAYRLGETERVDVRIEPYVGGRWYERTQDGQECDWGRVLAWEPPHHLVLSWQIGVGFRPQPDPNLASRVEVWFAADGPNATTVILIHSQFERHGEGWPSMRNGVAHEGGWPGILTTFANLVAE